MMCRRKYVHGVFNAGYHESTYVNIEGLILINLNWEGCTSSMQ